jgi:two-component system, NtrC family, nitrogen regulation sensor histidine kinase NtrY
LKPLRSSPRWSFPQTGAVIQPLFAAVLALVGVVVFAALISLIRSSSAQDAADFWQLPLSVTAVIIVGLFSYLAVKIIELGTKRTGRSAPQLHFHLVGFLSLAALVPAIVAAVFLGFIAVNVVDNWFSARVSAAVNTSADVMKEFLNDKLEDVQQEVRLMAEVDLNQPDVVAAFKTSPVIYTSYLRQSAQIRGFEALHIVDGSGNPVIKVDNVPDRPMIPTPSQLRQADNGIISWRLSRQSGFNRMVYKLNAYDGFYAVIGMTLLDTSTRELVDRAESVVVDYRAINEGRRSAQFFIAQIFAQITAILVLLAISYGLIVANRIVAPVDRLVLASRKVSEGDLNVRVPVGETRNELTILETAFNEMTATLRNQQHDLMLAKHDAETRQAFTEAVLSGVSVGVLSIGPDNDVQLSNDTAREQLAGDGAVQSLEHHNLTAIAPEFLDAVERVRHDEEAIIETEVDIERNGRARRFSVRAASTRHEADADHRIVLTFSDITRLVTAQRSAAWQDVARRIAHEIKNPLTPIQLSAERINRKYRGSLVGDLEVFDRCVETIVRQVSDIRRMVDEFSAFARMPKPARERANLIEIAKEQIFAQRVANPSVQFRLEYGDDALWLTGDSRLLGQALMNILKNAGEAVSEFLAGGHAEKSYQPTVTTSIFSDGEHAFIEVVDNGPGWPLAARERLLEPYMTTRERGTGLGLAIVARVLEDHRGRLELDTRADDQRGALVRFVLPLTDVAMSETIEPLSTTTS